MRILAENKKALFNYQVLDRYEAGIALSGWEVKSIKTGGASLKEAYVTPKGQDLWLVNAHFSRWAGANVDSKEEDRPRKLLLNQNEIARMVKIAAIKGNTIVPLNLHLANRGLIKLDIALARGAKQYEKREKIKKKEHERNLREELKKIGR